MVASPSVEMIMKLLQFLGGSPAPAQQNAPTSAEVPNLERYIKLLLRGETAGWGSKSDELRTRSSDYGDRADREFTRLLCRQF